MSPFPASEWWAADCGGAGALGGNANAGLEVLKDATAQAIADAKALLAAGKVSVKIREPCNEILFSRAKVWNGEKWACVTIVGGHTNIVHIETHNGVVFTQQACGRGRARVSADGAFQNDAG